MGIITSFSYTILPLLLLLLAFTFTGSRKNTFEEFIGGAKSGLETAVSLLPTLLLIMCGVNMMFASGAVDILTYVFSPILSFFGLPKEMLPTLILRPFSGSGATAVAGRLFSTSGPDSDVSKMSAVLMGCTDNIIYTLGVYFAACGIKKSNHALLSAFTIYIFGIFICAALGKVLVG